MENKSESSTTVRAHVFVSGRVQGVGFRYHTTFEARKRGVGGWVQNLPDGRVEAVFEGSKEVVETMIHWCHRGPDTAMVTDVAVEYESPEGIEQFKTRRISNK